MKLLGMTGLILFSSLQVLAAPDFICREFNNKSSIRYEVQGTTLDDVSHTHPEKNDYDAIHVVRLDLYQVKGKKSELVNTFQGYAKMEDVNYRVESGGKNAFSFWQYFDEDNQDGLEFVVNGRQVRLYLDCENQY